MNDKNGKKTQNALIVGLGNPEGKYFKTYHNAGFIAVDVLAKLLGLEFKKKGNQLICDIQVKKVFESLPDNLQPQLTVLNSKETLYNKVFILKPLTYMNLSGQAVLAVIRKHKIIPENIFVIFDDLYIDKGNIKLSFGGSGGGHNGIRSITGLIGTNKYNQIRIGIKPDKPPHSVSDYVLKKIDTISKPLIDSSIQNTVNATLMLITGSPITTVQTKYNTKQNN